MGSTLSDRRGLWAFLLSAVLVTGGVVMHAPMFLMGGNNHFSLAGMPIGPDMILGMAAIVVGCGIAAYGLLPVDIARQLAASQDNLRGADPRRLVGQGDAWPRPARPRSRRAHIRSDGNVDAGRSD